MAQEWKTLTCKYSVFNIFLVTFIWSKIKSKFKDLQIKFMYTEYPCVKQFNSFIHLITPTIRRSDILEPLTERLPWARKS